MKLRMNKKYNTIAAYAAATGCATVLIAFIILNLSNVAGFFQKIMSVLNPVIVGFIFAYLLNPLVKYYNSRLLGFTERKKQRKGLRKILSVIFAYMTVLLAAAVLIVFVVPQAAASYSDLSSMAGEYIGKFAKWVEDRASGDGLMSRLYESLLDRYGVENLTGLLKKSLNTVMIGASAVVGVFSNVIDQLKNIFFGLIISVYVLIGKEKLYGRTIKLMNAVFSAETVSRICLVAKQTDRTFGGFFVGKCIDSFIVGVITFIVSGMLGIPYYPLVSVIVGIMNIIPFFGPVIGAVAGGLIIFVAAPMKLIWFTIIVLAVQVLDWNFIAPRILGGKIGLSSLWVVVAITVMSGLFGVVGMFVGVPLFALAYSFIKSAVEKSLRSKERAGGDSDMSDKKSETENKEDEV